MSLMLMHSAVISIWKMVADLSLLFCCRCLVEEMRKVACALWEESGAHSPDSLFSVIWKLVPRFRWTPNPYISYQDHLPLNLILSLSLIPSPPCIWISHWSHLLLSLILRPPAQEAKKHENMSDCCSRDRTGWLKLPSDDRLTFNGQIYGRWMPAKQWEVLFSSQVASTWSNPPWTNFRPIPGVLLMPVFQAFWLWNVH